MFPLEEGVVREAPRLSKTPRTATNGDSDRLGARRSQEGRARLEAGDGLGKAFVLTCGTGPRQRRSQLGLLTEC